MKGQRSRRSRARRILIFGEDENDTKLLSELLVALRPEFQGLIKPFRRPPVLIKDAAARRIPDRVEAINALIAAEMTSAEVVCVFAHEDCDDFEPAHEALAEKIERAFGEAGYHVHAVTPAWETEAWLFLWPDAVAAHRPSWASLDPYRGRDVGKIANAKETLRRALRPAGKSNRVRDYRESDAPEVARIVRQLNLANTPGGHSASYDRFRDRVAACGDLPTA